MVSGNPAQGPLDATRLSRTAPASVRSERDGSAFVWRRVLRGVGPLFVARIVSGVTTLALYAGLARLLSVQQVGLFALAWSFAYILATVSEGGYGMLVIRETAQRPDDTGRYLGALIPLKIGAFLPVVGVAVALGMTVYSWDVAVVIATATVAGYLQLAAQTGRDFLLPPARYGTAAVLSIVENLVWLAVTLMVAAFSGSVLLAWVASALVYAASAGGTFWIVVTLLRPKGIRFGMADWRGVGISAVGFGLFVTLTALFFHIHAVMASLLLPLSSVAILQVALRVFFAAEYLPETAARWAYPSLSRSVTSDVDRFARQSTRLAGILVVIGCAVAGALVLAAPYLVPLLFSSAYEDAVIPLQILALAVPLRYAAHAYGTTLSAGGRQTPRALVAAGVIALTIALEIILIGLFGVIGAAVSVTVASALLVMGYFTVASATWRHRVSGWPPLLGASATVVLGAAVIITR